jgi:hypothetical protein
MKLLVRWRRRRKVDLDALAAAISRPTEPYAVPHAGDSVAIVFPAASRAQIEAEAATACPSIAVSQVT